MPKPYAGPIKSIPVGPVATGTLVFRLHGQLYATIILKASFSFANDSVMPLCGQKPALRRHEEHHEHNPMRSIRAPSDWVPFLNKVDILFSGSAHAPRGTSTAALPVRLSIGRAEDGQISVVFDKQLLARSVSKDGGSGPPFERMPIIYERAFGGIGHLLNPIGTQNPTIVYIAPEAKELPAGFGPISSRWPSRKKRLQGHTLRPLEDPLLELPAEFDAFYFQSAPDDQRLDYLAGDEIILLEHLHAEHPELEMRLPGARALYRVVTAAGMSKPVGLNPDTLFIDGDAQTCTLTYRGYFPLYSEEVIQTITVLAGIELGDQLMDWNMDVSAFNSEELQAQKPERAAVSANLAEQTLTMAEEATTINQRIPTFPVSSSAERTAPAPPDLRHSTLMLTDAGEKPHSSPFPLSKPSQKPARASSSPIPGAPWASQAAKPVPTASNLESTLSLMDVADAEAQRVVEEATAKLPTPQSTPPPPPPKPAPVESAAPAKPAWSWAPPPPSEIADTNTPAPQKSSPPPRKSLKDKLYGGSAGRNTKK